MAIDITMPALSPTMETGKLARWHVKPGDAVRPGDVLAEIETDKATMEFEAVDEGTISAILVPEGTENVKVNAVIARLAEPDEDTTAAPAPAAAAAPGPVPEPAPAQTPAPAPAQTPAPEPAPAPRPTAAASGPRTIASPLARRIAAKAGLDLAGLSGSGPHGRIVKADVDARLQAGPQKAPAGQAAVRPEAAPAAAAPAKAAPAGPPSEVPHEDQKLSSMRRVIARRLTESKQTVPHYYLTIDVCLDPLLALRTELNAALQSRGIKLSVNDLLIKALAAALVAVPDANVSFTGDAIRRYRRADISVAVAIPGGLITPVVRDAAAKSISAVAAEMKDLSARARDGKLQPPEYTGGTASLSNLGMYGIRQFEAVINPPEGMILAVGAGQRRPWVADDRLTVATVLSATGSFDHRAIDGAVGAQLMQAFQNAVEHPITLIA